MIKTFGDKNTQKLWEAIRIKTLPAHLLQKARRKLGIINAATEFQDLQIPKSNHLEKLKNNLKEYHSIRINDQYRIVFKWNEEEANAYEVYIDDYH